MRTALRRAMGPWMDAARGVGFFILLVAGSVALGFAIAWPLWLLATREGRIYTILVLALVAAGVILLAARSVVRRRYEPRDPGKPRRTPLSLLLSFFMVLIACGGAYAASVFIYRGLWIFVLFTVPVWACLLWLLGLARRAVRRRASMTRKEPFPPAENKGE
jgi:hypothetical protein